jgi:hypothetical protein
MIQQHRYHLPRKSKPHAAVCLQQTFHNYPVCARLLLGTDLKGYATAACVECFSLWTKAK